MIHSHELAMYSYLPPLTVMSTCNALCDIKTIKAQKTQLLARVRHINLFNTIYFRFSYLTFRFHIIKLLHFPLPNYNSLQTIDFYTFLSNTLSNPQTPPPLSIFSFTLCQHSRKHSIQLFFYNVLFSRSNNFFNYLISNLY